MLAKPNWSHPAWSVVLSLRLRIGKTHYEQSTMLQKKPTCGRARSLHVAKTDTHGMPGIPNGGTNGVGIGTAAWTMKGSTNAMLPLALALLAACMAPCADAAAAFNVTRLLASQAKVTNITYGNSGESYAVCGRTPRRTQAADLLHTTIRARPPSVTSDHNSPLPTTHHPPPTTHHPPLATQT